MKSQTGFAEHRGGELATGIACSPRDVNLIAQHPGVAFWEMCLDCLQPLLYYLHSSPVMPVVKSFALTWKRYYRLNRFMPLGGG